MLCSTVLVACRTQEPVSVAPLALQPLPTELEQQPRPPQPDLGLISLPTVGEVQQAAPGGRANPFQPLRSQQAELDGGGEVFDPASGLVLTGVLQVGRQHRALVQSPAGGGELCVSIDGRCDAGGDPLLPPGWSVLSIDVEQGCLGLARDGEPQDLICLS